MLVGLFFDFWHYGDEWGIEVGGGVDFEIVHRSGVTKWGALIATKDNDRGTFVAFSHEENCHTGERVNEIDLGNFHFTAKEIRFATNVF